MNCPTCQRLERDFETAFSAYIDARSSASFSVCPKVAASKNVEMERTKYELEEHKLVCVFLRVVARPARAERVLELEPLVA